MKGSVYLKYLISILVIAALIVYVVKDDDFQWSYLSDVKGLFVFILISFFSVYLSGLQLFLLIKNQKVKLKFVDQLLLPLSMAFFGYIIPTNGGLFFSVYFLKKKYNIRSIDGISIGVYIIYISFILTGLLGLLYCLLYDNQVKIIFPVSMLMIIFPFIVNIISNGVIKLNLSRVKIIEKIVSYLNTVTREANSHFKNRIVFFQLISINILMIVVNIISNFWLIKMFHIQIPVLSLILMVLFMRLSSIIKILPGNFGVDELFAGGIFLFFGLPASDGIMLSVYSRIVSLVFLIVPFGILHLIINNNVLKISDIKEFRKIFMANKTP